VIKQNLTWSALYNGLAIPAAAMGYVTPWMAGIGMSLSSLLVVLNAMRLSGYKGPAREYSAARPKAES
jgi:Cu2+-exporting ATPase